MLSFFSLSCFFCIYSISSSPLTPRGIPNPHRGDPPPSPSTAAQEAACRRATVVARGGARRQGDGGLCIGKQHVMRRGRGGVPAAGKAACKGACRRAASGGLGGKRGQRRACGAAHEGGGAVGLGCAGSRVGRRRGQHGGGEALGLGGESSRAGAGCRPAAARALASGGASPSRSGGSHGGSSRGDEVGGGGVRRGGEGDGGSHSPAATRNPADRDGRGGATGGSWLRACVLGQMGTLAGNTQTWVATQKIWVSNFLGMLLELAFGRYMSCTSFFPTKGYT
ncbi:hypothetical protein BRADI_3g07666v3 [Brachypodium distachyon]|uniref:Uncharacterized protein n=1 Tax=Brachypodium distachyon TaxID=15368 RepID=A0A2K2CVT8_BRADI|nr:hypothetical protein BRADI_3g07666v3 [Brachypodium distachyon]